MEVILVCNAHIAKMILCELLECYNIAKEQYDE
jgi:hypothetical protein